MPITYQEKTRTFRIEAGDSLMLLQIVDDGYLLQPYYGPSFPDEDIDFLLRKSEYPYTPSVNRRDQVAFMETAPFAYPCYGIGDFREPAFQILESSGTTTCDLRYHSHTILTGKPDFPGLPATHALPNQAVTLAIVMKERSAGLKVILYYTVFSHSNTIAVRARITNRGAESCRILRALSVSVDLEPNCKMDMITLDGAWARERRPHRTPLSAGKLRIDSMRGVSSHQHNPFFALAQEGATETYGNVYGFCLVYSGNFMAQAEVNQFDGIRAQIGLNPTDFSWKLDPGKSFDTPEALLVYSNAGFSRLSRMYHSIMRRYLIRNPYKDMPRPILINSWEATFFDFDAKKLLQIAREASAMGLDMLVMDDGWFGHRSNDESSLGDWVVWEEKLGCSLTKLSNELGQMGMSLGLWIEPEMVSPDSDLYRAHSDWAIQIRGRDMTQSRSQYVLDFTRKEVRDYIYDMIKKLLQSARIRYVKWDMNRMITEPASFELPADRQQEFCHRYMLGVYDLLERLVTDFPKILLETCASGGARFDAGMLRYSPQIWTSDNTDAFERLRIQAGTSLCYPVSTIGAHVSACPNHITGRMVSLTTRAHIAMHGTFGYELDVTTLSQEEKDQIPDQITWYRKMEPLLRDGYYYRLSDLFGADDYAAWMVVTKDQREAAVTYVQARSQVNQRSVRLVLRGLHPKIFYKEQTTGAVYSGTLLMQVGLPIPQTWGDCQSTVFYLIEQKGGRRTK